MYTTDQAYPFVAKSVAGIPESVHGQLFYNGTPDVMADYAIKVRNYGARIIGACCLAAARRTLPPWPKPWPMRPLNGMW